MNKFKFLDKVVANYVLIMVVCILCTINSQAQGPTSPEASSFEPVDATDMVSLGTGDLTYVLPLLNVPSPEGGYPLALSYHAGIAMDQESSWVGLGWTLNPGAINRSVNGYPDDWKDARFKEYFYDSGDQATYLSASLGYTSFTTGGGSVGVSISHSDDKGFGGAVSFGFGVGENASVNGSLGSDGASVGASIGIKETPFSIGGSVGTNGFGLSGGIGWEEKSGKKGMYYNQSFSLGLNSSWSGDISVNANYGKGEGSKKNSIGINLSSKGISVTGKIKGVGTGANFAFENAVSQSDYNIKKSGWFIPLYIPTAEGMITASFGYQKIEYYLDKLETTGVSGPLYFKGLEATTGRWECSYNNGPLNFKHHVDPGHTHPNVDSYVVNYINDVDSFGDIYEVDFNGTSNNTLELDRNNAVFPNYDNYRVTAQGISGSMKPTLYRNAALQGLRKDIEESGSYNSDYEISYKTQNNTNAGFNIEPEFHFENEYSSSLLVDPANFNNSNSNISIFDYLDSAPSIEEERKRGGRYVESFTNTELSTSAAYTTGLLKANATINYGDITNFDPDGIGAFKVTTPDGKTYHYSIPVYNHEVVSRQYGMIASRPGEEQAFFEKRQLKKYATHWLLTAITGPDFVDINGNNLADDDDYGYWVTMDYGKWSNGYIWYAPHGEEYSVDSSNPDLKYYTWGRKEIYYLDKVITRTHTALFIKEERNDSQGKQLFYKHRLDKNTNKTISFKGQSLLRLREVILLDNDEASSISKNNVGSLSSIPAPNFSETVTFYDKIYEDGDSKVINYSMQNNVLDINDFTSLNTLRDKSLKIVDFSGYSYDLASGAPYTFGGVNGRLTLNHVTFKGKGGVQLKPSYNFEYHLGSYYLNQKDKWGYNKFYPKVWNLREITMPTGGKIEIEYEPKTFISATEHELFFDGVVSNGNEITIHSDEPFSDYNVSSNSQLPVSYIEFQSCTEHDNAGNPLIDHVLYDYKSFYGMATVISVSNAGKTLTLRFNGDPTLHTDVYSSKTSCSDLSSDYPEIARVTIPTGDYSAGVRVKSVKTTDGFAEYRTDYDYSIPGTSNTSGIVSYVPYINEVTNEVPYGMELPPPVPMYGHVKTTSYGTNNESLGYTQYEFKVLPIKHNVTNVGFQDVLELSPAPQSSSSSGNFAVLLKNIELKDNMASLGQLLSKASYNNYGQLLSKTINNYKSTENISQGITQESFQTYKEIDYENNNNGSDRWLISSSTRTTYPSVLESTTVIQGGFTSTTYFDTYDEISSQLLETRTESSDGTEFKTETIPAYTKYSDLGSKADNVNNKNMLTQEAMTKSYINQSGSWKETGVGITTWKPDVYSYNVNGAILSTDVWRKHKTFTWNGQLDGNGVYVNFSGEDDGFNWNVNAGSQAAQWKQLSEITKYDEYSLPLESVDINGNYAATKMGDRNTKVMAVANAAYQEMFYSGAEYLDGSTFDDGISSVGRTLVKAHTGKYSIEVSTQQGFKTDLLSGHRAGRYKISVWASKDNYTNAKVFDGLSLKSFNGEVIPSGDWVLLNHYVDWDTNSKTVYVKANSGTIFFDDFRIHPVTSSMVTYVYNDWEELEAVLGANNLSTTYEYDAIGRLVRTFSEVVDDTNLTGGFKKVAEHIYQFSNPIEGVIQPLFATVTYGASNATHQEFIATVTGGSGNYSFKWYKGIGDSSTQFETAWSSTSPNFDWTNLSGCDTRYVKLVVTDNQYGYLGESIRVIRNNNECDSGSGGGNPQN